MALISVTEAGVSICASGDGYSLKKDGCTFAHIPSGMIDQMVVGPDVDISRKAMEKMMDIGVPLAFIDSFGRLRTRLTPVWKHNALPRIGQSLSWDNESIRLLLAKRFVAAKLINSVHILKSYAKNYSYPVIKLSRDKIVKNIEAIARASSLNEVLGIEGISAKIYWEAFGSLLKCDFCRWEGRNRRPPRDPINAALSYSYAIITSLVIGYLELSGLDPYIGYLHSVDAGKPSLALDMVEPFRAIYVDKIVLKLFNRKQFNAAHFINNGVHGVFMNLEARKLLAKEIYGAIKSSDEDMDSYALETHILRDIESFKKLAQARELEDFVPYIVGGGDDICKCQDLL